MLIVFFFLLWLHKHRRFSGQVILFYALLYSIIRFAIEFVRDDPRGDILGLTTRYGSINLANYQSHCRSRGADPAYHSLAQERRRREG